MEGISFKGGKKSLSQRLAAASIARTTKNTENVSTSSPTSSSIDEDYMFEPFSYAEDNFDIYDEPENFVSLPSKENKPKGLPSINRTNKKC